jgi:hypothetical protein
LDPACQEIDLDTLLEDGDFFVGVFQLCSNSFDALKNKHDIDFVCIGDARSIPALLEDGAFFVEMLVLLDPHSLSSKSFDTLKKDGVDRGFIGDAISIIALMEDESFFVEVLQSVLDSHSLCSK